MVNKVLDFIKKNKILEYGDSVLLGVSGGADSICMLYVLNEIKPSFSLTLHVVHVNHLIRGQEAQKDADYVQSTCKKMGIPCTLIQADVPAMVRESGMSEEEAGRKARYKIFYQEALRCGANKISVAHNLNDNSETILFHLFRGSGIKGLMGIPVKRDMIIRPLLCCTRQEIEDYLNKNKIVYCTDKTNTETEYSRNKIRIDIFPYIKKNINQRAEYNIVNAAGNLREIYDYMEQEAAKAYKKYVKDGCLLEKSFALHPALLNMIIRMMIEKTAGKLKDITRVHVMSVMELRNAEVSKYVNLPYNLVAKRTYTGIKIEKNIPGKSKKIKQPLIINGKICNNRKVEITLETKQNNIGNIPQLVYTKWFDYDKIHELTLRNRQEGDYIVIDDLGRRKKLKDYFINEKVPRDQRDNILLLADGSHIVWIIGYRISSYYKVTESTSNIIKVTFINE